MHHRKKLMHINFFAKIVLAGQSKPYTQIYLQKLQIAQICNLQSEFKEITHFGHALPLNGYSSRF